MDSAPDPAAVPAPEPADEVLMHAWVGGDVQAFEQLYARHRGPLYRFLLRHTRDGVLADEIFQDTWQRVIGARAGWTPEAAFSAWLFRIAHNRLGDHWRALKHRPAAPVDADLRAARIPDPTTPERELSEFEQRRRLQRAIEDLPEEQRDLVRRAFYDDLSHSEIAEATGLALGTVKSRLRLAFGKLRALLEEPA